MSSINNILNYLKGNRRGQKANSLEQEALNDPFLYDALEGLDSSEQPRKTLIDLRRQMNARIAVDGRSLRRTWRQSLRYSAVLVPAAVALVLVAAPVVLLSEKAKSFSLADYQTTYVWEEEAVPVNLPGPPAPLEIESNISSLGDVLLIIDDHILISDRTIVSETIEKDGSGTGVDIEQYEEFRAEEEQPVEEEIPFTMVDEKPQFMGGNENMFVKWVGKNLQYPDAAREQGLQGRVVAEFVVDIEGNVTHVKILRSIAPVLDREAARVLNSSPRWTPGKQHGLPVRVRYIFPVDFILK